MPGDFGSFGTYLLHKIVINKTMFTINYAGRKIQLVLQFYPDLILYADWHAWDVTEHKSFNVFFNTNWMSV